MRNPSQLLLIFAIIAKFILQYIFVHPVYELHRDEFLHLDQANHLAWGYLSVPPFTSWNSLLIQWLGNTEFWIKFFPALYGALTMIVVWNITRSLGGKWFALFFSVLAVMFSVIFRLNMLYQPNSFDVFAWTFVYYAIIRFIQTEKIRWVYWGSLVLALGVLNKYNIGFLVLGILPGILLTPQRKLLGDWRIYPALLLGLVIVFPNILWQIRHDLPVVHHMEALARTQLHRLTATGFLKEQLLFFIGSFYAIVAGLVGLWFYPAFRPYRFLLFSFFITVSLFIFFKAKGYYAIGLYPAILAFGAVYLESLLVQGWRRHLRPVLLAIPVLVFIPLANLVFPVAPPEKIQEHLEDFDRLGLLTWEDGKKYNLPQDFADMLGWREIATLADSAVDLAGDPANTFVLCDNYGQAGAINYYARHRGMAYSMSADYINWIPSNLNTRHVVVVQDRGGKESDIHANTPYFESITLVGKVRNDYAREKDTKVWLLKNSKINVDSVIQIIRNDALW